MLGYLPKLNKLFLADKSLNVTAYTLHVSIINYQVTISFPFLPSFPSPFVHLSFLPLQTAVLRKDLAAAASILPNIPKEFHERISVFLEAQGHREAALDVAVDNDRKFDLAVSLSRLDIAMQIAAGTFFFFFFFEFALVFSSESSAAESSDYKWKQLADLALQNNQLAVAEQSLQRAEDVSGLLLLYIATANSVGLQVPSVQPRCLFISFSF